MERLVQMKKCGKMKPRKRENLKAQKNKDAETQKYGNA